MKLGKTQRALYTTLVTIGSILGLACCLIIFWLVKPYSYIDATQPNTLGSKYHEGEVITIVYESFCMKAQTDLMVQRFVFNTGTGQRIALLPYSFTREHTVISCYDDLAVRVPLPKEVVTGEYTITTELSYKPNPVRKVVQEFTTNPFTVIGE